MFPFLLPPAETYGARLCGGESWSVSTEAGVHNRVESVSGQGGAGADAGAGAGQCCLWQGTQHWLKESIPKEVHSF